MPKFYVQTYAKVHIGEIEVEANSYHEAAAKADLIVQKDYLQDKGDEGKLIIGQYLEIEEAELHLGDPDSAYDNTRFLELSTSSGPDENSRSSVVIFQA